MSLNVFEVGCQENNSLFYCEVAAFDAKAVEKFMEEKRPRFEVLHIKPEPVEVLANETDLTARLIKMKSL